MHNLIKELLSIPNIKLMELEELMGKDFENALDYSQITRIKEGTRFIVVDELITTIWILLSGEVKALEEYSTGDIYTFKKFKASEIFGEMELLADVNKFRATLISETDCVFLNIPADVYKDFLKSNSEYLYKRTNNILKRVLDEQRYLRTFLMIKSLDRVKIYFTQHYELYSKKDKCILRITRQQIAEETGYSVKTINRAIRELDEARLLTVEGQRIIITKSQYEKMYEGVEGFINY